MNIVFEIVACLKKYQQATIQKKAPAKKWNGVIEICAIKSKHETKNKLK
jgi:hypothetical protein